LIIASQFELAQPPTDAVSSLVFAPQDSTRLLVSSWDKHVYLYDTSPSDGEGGILVRSFEHRAPVLDVCFGADDNEAFSAGMDWQVKRYAWMRKTHGATGLTIPDLTSRRATKRW
jgi:cell cycle arrest protein BUB3